MLTMDDRLAQVPDFARFYTVDELYGRAREAARRRPDLFDCQDIGRSTAGEAIPMLSVGRGPTQVMLVALPHPNEPIGAMLVAHLLEALEADQELRERATWYLLPCVDPDGARLNEGWFPGPFTLRRYAQHFYRPRPQEQVEWTFPLTYKTYKWDAPIPETQALMKAIQQVRPHVLYSLHNAGFGGAYYYISHDLPGVYPVLHRLPEERGLALSLGEPEMPWAEAFAPAVYRVPRSTDAYDYYERFGGGDPAAAMTGGASSFEFAARICDPVCLVTELPYFQSPQIGDTTPLAQTRREVILAGVERARAMYEVMERVIGRTEALMGDVSGPDEVGRCWRAVTSFVAHSRPMLDSQARWAREAEGMDQPATVAQQADAWYVGSFYRVLVASLLDRALRVRVAEGAPRAVAEARAELRRHIDGWLTEIEENLSFTTVPIRHLVQIQYGALLAVLEELDRR